MKKTHKRLHDIRNDSRESLLPIEDKDHFCEFVSDRDLITRHFSEFRISYVTRQIYIYILVMLFPSKIIANYCLFSKIILYFLKLTSISEFEIKY